MSYPLLETIGLRALPPTGPQPPSWAATAIMTNFFLSYAIFSTRGIKRVLGFDHNASPREDVQKYGEQLVKKGKITHAQLARVKRWESLYSNSVENFPLFFGGVLFALHSGVPNVTINGLALGYTLARIAYGISYIVIESEEWSFVRTVCWWTGNISVLTLIGKSGNLLNGVV